MKRNVKIVTAILLVVTMLFSLCGCGKLSKGEKIVKNMLEAFKTADFEKAGKYINLEEFLAESSDVAIAGSAETYLKAALTGFDYEILSSEKANDGSVNVTVRIQTVYMKAVIDDFLIKAMEYLMASATADPRPTPEQTAEKLDELMGESANQFKDNKATNEVIMNVSKIDGKWTVDANDNVFNAIFGGLLTAIDEVKNGLQ